MRVAFCDVGKVSLLELVRLQEDWRQSRVKNAIPDTVIFAEHPPTISINTRNAARDLQYLKISPGSLATNGMTLISLDRGGSIAVHGPGILGCYFVFQCSAAKSPAHHIEEWFLRALGRCPVQLYPFPRGIRRRALSATEITKYRGLWHGTKKIGTTGLRIHNHVSTFGYNINVDPDPRLLALIHPCGITEYTLGSLADIVQKSILIEKIKNILINTPW